MSIDDLGEGTPRQGSKPKFFHHLDFEGKRKSIAAWALEKNIGVATLYTRIRAGWAVERALTTPEGPPAITTPSELAIEAKVDPEEADSEEVEDETESELVEPRLPVTHPALEAPRSRRGPKPYKIYTFNGETAHLGVFARKLGTTTDVLRCRLNQGWPVERAFTEPVHTKAGLKPRVPQGISHPDYVPPAKPSPSPALAKQVAKAAFAATKPDFLVTLRTKLAKVDEIDEKRARVSAELAELADGRSALVEEIRELIRSTPASKM
jgi:hypothetical protein